MRAACCVRSIALYLQFDTRERFGPDVPFAESQNGSSSFRNPSGKGTKGDEDRRRDPCSQ
ncbi:fungal-specific transcription factor domain protein [Apiospora arundinis]|uniref:Uncharacterized protein n=1 Tax=Apiospora arundinis TaxID=335852 RepID=A0ABR2HZP3_9PEZI